jgi:hypothetical protein
MQVLDASSEIDAPAATVWGVVHDVARYPEWNPFVRRLTGDVRDGGRIDVTVQAPGRKPITFKARVMRLDPGRELRWKGQWFLPGLFDGEHALTVEALGPSRARFRTWEHVTGLLLPLLGKAMRQSQAGFDQFAVAVKARAESLANAESLGRADASAGGESIAGSGDRGSDPGPAADRQAGTEGPT